MERIARLAAHLNPQQQEQQVEAQLQAKATAVTGSAGKKVAVLGAAGGIGQPLALLLKLNPNVSHLHLYDVVNTPGVGADISHIDSPARVSAFVGAEQLAQALYGVDLVLIPAGVPRKPGMTRDDLFKINAGIVKTLCEGIARYCPAAWVGIISNPVNSTVPIAAEVFKRAGTYNPTRLFGVTTLDVVRANEFVAGAMGACPTEVDVPVVGGHAGKTILPLLSQVNGLVLDAEAAKKLTIRIQDAGTEVVTAKAGAGSATLSMAYAAARFGDSCLAAMAGKPVRICAYVQSSQVPDIPFFAGPVKLGPSGIEEVLSLGVMNAFEQQGLKEMAAELKGSIQKGIDLVSNAR